MDAGVIIAYLGLSRLSRSLVLKVDHEIAMFGVTVNQIDAFMLNSIVAVDEHKMVSVFSGVKMLRLVINHSLEVRRYLTSTRLVIVINYPNIGNNM